MQNKVGERVRNFYNKTPFPDYTLEGFNSKEDLRISAYPFAKILDRSIPTNASVIDVGTGTGQLSAFLSLRRKNVWGIDFSEASLSKAAALKQKLKLDTLHLKKVDIMELEQVKSIGQQLDYVLCLGVLHHTSNPYQAFRNVLHLLKPQGYIAIGLYNKLGRIPLKMRRLLAKKIFKKNKGVKDWFIRMQIGEVEDKERTRGWWNDQYLHPHESTHTVGEVLKWFRKTGIGYHQSVPSLNFFDKTDFEIAGVWNRTNQKLPYIPLRILKQLSWIWKTHHEGGYWITFGRKVG